MKGNILAWGENNRSQPIWLVGGIPTPLKNHGVRQLGWWHSIPNCFWKVIQNSMVPNHHFIETTTYTLDRNVQACGRPYPRRPTGEKYIKQNCRLYSHRCNNHTIDLLKNHGVPPKSCQFHGKKQRWMNHDKPTKKKHIEPLGFDLYSIPIHIPYMDLFGGSSCVSPWFFGTKKQTLSGLAHAQKRCHWGARCDSSSHGTWGVGDDFYLMGMEI